MLAQEEVAKKTLEVAVISRYPDNSIAIIRTGKGVSEIPGAIFKRLIVNIESDAAKILDNKKCRGSRVALQKRMLHPDPRSEFCNMIGFLLKSEWRIVEVLFPVEKYGDLILEGLPMPVLNRVTIKHPLRLDDVVSSIASRRVPLKTGEEPFVDCLANSRSA
jgi:hypothetical protein